MFITNKCQRHWLRRRHWPSSPSRKEEEKKKRKKRHLTSETVISKTNGVWRTRSKVTKHFPSQHIPHTPQASRCWVQTAWNSLLTCVLQLMKSGKLKILLRYTGIHVRRDKEERKRGEGEKKEFHNQHYPWHLNFNPKPTQCFIFLPKTWKHQNKIYWKLYLFVKKAPLQRQDFQPVKPSNM